MIREPSAQVSDVPGGLLNNVAKPIAKARIHEIGQGKLYSVDTHAIWRPICIYTTDEYLSSI